MKILRYSDAVYAHTQYMASFARIRVKSNFSNFKNVSAMIFNLQPNFPLQQILQGQVNTTSKFMGIKNPQCHVGNEPLDLKGLHKV